MRRSQGEHQHLFSDRLQVGHTASRPYVRATCSKAERGYEGPKLEVLARAPGFSESMPAADGALPEVAHARKVLGAESVAVR